jgi:hypothetical protein
MFCMPGPGEAPVEEEGSNLLEGVGGGKHEFKSPILEKAAKEIQANRDKEAAERKIPAVVKGADAKALPPLDTTNES